MKLKKCLSYGKGKWLASEVNTTPTYISQIANGFARPSPALALRIERALGGAVTRDELLFPELYEQEETV